MTLRLGARSFTAQGKLDQPRPDDPLPHRQCMRRKSRGGSQQPFTVARFRSAGERNEHFQLTGRGVRCRSVWCRGVGVRFGQLAGAGAPRVERQAFERDAGGVSQPGIGVIECGPNFVEVGRVGAPREACQVCSTSALCRCESARVGDVAAGRRGGVHRLRRPLGGGHSVQRRLGLASAGNQVERAVGAGGQIGDIERPALQEQLGVRAPSGALGKQMDRHNAAVGPVERKQRRAVRRGEGERVAKHDGGRRAATDIDDRRRVLGLVVKPRRPLATRFAIAGVATFEQLDDPRGTVPRSAHVKLVVCVKREQVAARMRRDAVRVAKPRGDDLPLAAGPVETQQIAFPAGLATARRTQGRCQIKHVFRRRLHTVAMNREQAAVLGREIVSPVPDTAGKRPQRFQGPDATIVADSQAIDGLGIVRVGVQPAVVVDQSTALVERHIERFHLRHRGAVVIQCEPQQAAVFARNGEPPLGVERHRDPASLIGGRGANEGDFEARRGPEFRTPLDGIGAECLPPLFVVFVSGQRDIAPPDSPEFVGRRTAIHCRFPLRFRGRMARRGRWIDDAEGGVGHKRRARTRQGLQGERQREGGWTSDRLERDFEFIATAAQPTGRRQGLHGTVGLDPRKQPAIDVNRHSREVRRQSQFGRLNSLRRFELSPENRPGRRRGERGCGTRGAGRHRFRVRRRCRGGGRREPTRRGSGGADGRVGPCCERRYGQGQQRDRLRE